MKKTYVKPALMLEQFNLTQSIASGCGVFESATSTLGKPAFAQGGCGWDMGNFIVWTEALGCNYTWDLDAPYADVICYNNPNGNMSIFNS